MAWCKHAHTLSIVADIGSSPACSYKAQVKALFTKLHSVCVIELYISLDYKAPHSAHSHGSIRLCDNRPACSWRFSGVFFMHISVCLAFIQYMLFLCAVLLFVFLFFGPHFSESMYKSAGTLKFHPLPLSLEYITTMTSVLRCLCWAWQR